MSRRRRDRRGKSSRLGVCALTKMPGVFVKSHIIPQALTETIWRGQPLTQRGRSGQSVRRWTSWYDPELVTVAGEKILADLDTWAIELLRSKKLVWSSWGPMTRLVSSDLEEMSATQFGRRVIAGVDSDRLRIFFLSLLWRAAQSRLEEMRQIHLTPEDLEKLRIMVLHSLPQPYEFFPVTLIQFSTLGMPHNFAPKLSTKTEPQMDFVTQRLVPGREVPYFRFYMDGLVAHFHLSETREYVNQVGNYFIGKENSIEVTTIPAERAGQFKRYWYNATGRELNYEEIVRIRENIRSTE